MPEQAGSKRQRKRGSSVPIKPNVFTNIAWDNIVSLEETLSGKGTSHRVDGIVVQARTFGPDLPSSELPRIAKSKQRALRSSEDQALIEYVPGECAGPPPLVTKEDLTPTGDKTAKEAAA